MAGVFERKPVKMPWYTQHHSRISNWATIRLIGIDYFDKMTTWNIDFDEMPSAHKER